MPCITTFDQKETPHPKQLLKSRTKNWSKKHKNIPSLCLVRKDFHKKDTFRIAIAEKRAENVHIFTEPPQAIPQKIKIPPQNNICIYVTLKTHSQPHRSGGGWFAVLTWRKPKKKNVGPQVRQLNDFMFGSSHLKSRMFGNSTEFWFGRIWREGCVFLCVFVCFLGWLRKRDVGCVFCNSMLVSSLQMWL